MLLMLYGYRGFAEKVPHPVLSPDACTSRLMMGAPIA